MWSLCAACRNGTMANGTECVRCGTSFLHAQKGGKEASEDPLESSHNTTPIEGFVRSLVLKKVGKKQHIGGSLANQGRAVPNGCSRFVPKSPSRGQAATAP